MAKKKNEDIHLDIYLDHSELHCNGEETIFKEGKQSNDAQARYNKVICELENGYLDSIYQHCGDNNMTNLSEHIKSQINNLVNGITSEVGRALVGLTFLQITIKSITPNQSIRLHKGSTRKGSFSWVEGISMRTIDSDFIAPFCEKKVY